MNNDIYEYTKNITKVIMDYFLQNRLVPSIPEFKKRTNQILEVYVLYALKYKIMETDILLHNLKELFDKNTFPPILNLYFTQEKDDNDAKKIYLSQFSPFINDLNDQNEKILINYKISFYDLRYAFLHANLDDLNSVITAKIKMDDMLNNSFMYIIENDINKVLENYKRYNENRDKIKDIVDKEYIEKCDMYIGNFLEKLAKTIIV